MLDPLPFLRGPGADGLADSRPGLLQRSTVQRPLPLVPEDLLTDTERLLDGFARIARAVARGDLRRLPINSLAVSLLGKPDIEPTSPNDRV